MNRIEDNDIREALRRSGGLLPDVDVPDDFTQKVMARIETQQSHRIRKIVFAAMAMAASFTLLLVLFLPTNKQTEFAKLEKPAAAVCKDTRQEAKPTTDANIATKTTCTKQKIKVNADTTVAVEKKPESSYLHEVAVDMQPSSADDDMNSYMAALEQQLDDIRDSCYMLQVERMIMSDKQLCHLMEEMNIGQ